ncbi:hypothetical protein PM082_022947 [Marasmius tenuissimus]|nr:hypothetical protein PM082_022947 [Marasmius tenuissimus]
MTELCLPGQLRDRYMTDPGATVCSYEPKLSPVEQHALKLNNPNAVFRLMLARGSEVAAGKELTEDDIDGAADEAQQRVAPLVILLFLLIT